MSAESVVLITLLVQLGVAAVAILRFSRMGRGSGDFARDNRGMLLALIASSVLSLVALISWQWFA